MKRSMISVAFMFGFAAIAFGQVLLDTLTVKAEVDSLYKMAHQLFKSGNSEKALSIVNTNLIYIHINLGQELRYAKSLNLKAMCLSTLNDFDEAERLWLECLQIRKNRLNNKHPACAEVLLNLGVNCLQNGRFMAAEQYMLDAKDIFIQNTKMYNEMSRVLNMLGNLYESIGRFEEAEKILLECLSYYENGILEKNTDSHASVLMNLGALYFDLGNYVKAEPYYIETKSILENVLGKLHPKYISSISNLGILYDNMHLINKAEPLLIEVVELRSKVLGKDHPDFASSLGNLANLYFYSNRLEKAIPLLLKAKEITEKSLGKSHPDYVIRVNNLGALYASLGNYSKAKKYLKESLLLYEKLVGKYHPDYINGLSMLAFVYHQTKNYILSESYFIEALQSNQLFINKAVTWQSEQELSSTSSFFIEDISRLLTIQYFSNNEFLPYISYNNSLFLKGFLLNSVVAIKNRALSNTRTSETWHQLANVQRQLSDEYTKPINDRDSSIITQLELKANGFEKKLAQIVDGFGNAYRIVGWNDIRQKLNSDEVAIEFVQFNKNFPKPTDSTYYAALILRTDGDQPRFIPLFEEKELSKLLNCKGLDLIECISTYYPTSKNSPLYKLLFQQIEPYLSGVKNIIFSPAGLLHKINIGAIGFGADSIMSQKYHLIQLGSTRQLIDRDSIYEEKTQPTAYLFGGVQYEMDSSAISIANAKLDTALAFATRGSLEIQFSVADSTMQSKGFNYLQGTAEEISNIQSIIQKSGISVKTFSGFEATEEAFKHIGLNANPPRILHLATHGFFFPDPKNKNEGQSVENNEPVFKMSDHPMIRSGLILAGGNLAWQSHKSANSDLEDGILTAYEISQSNLRGTELVVLSACETGLGQIESNEGVYGLQRAFKIAGVRYLLMSLWSIPDQATQEFMTLFYQKWLTENLPLPEAFQTTQSMMRNKYPNKPVNWAGWVLVE